VGVKQFQQIIAQCFLSNYVSSDKLGQPISSQFESPTISIADNLRKLNAAFLICLGGKGSKSFRSAFEFLNLYCADEEIEAVRSLYATGLSLMEKEIEEVAERDSEFEATLINISNKINKEGARLESTKDVATLWEVFFPEGARLCGPKEEMVRELREKRKVKIQRINPKPIENPLQEILFTTNILLTVPLADNPADLHCVPQGLVGPVLQARHSTQSYWYDHPIPIGIPPEKNELVYGLEALNDAVDFEKKFRGAPESAKLRCLLSVSVTHDALKSLAKPLIMEIIRSAGNLEHLDIFLWTETDTEALARNVLAPGVRRCLGYDAESDLRAVIGVNGEYGRHYSFLRAISALWKVCCGPELRGTFKIDLDQVFPQEQLVEETGRSAFDHFLSPLWGADGVDSNGERVHLGMIAGALVNYEDASRSVFVPDVRYPEQPPMADEVIFFSRLPQAVSTEAEMMTRYGTGEFGSDTCIQRIHVTGGMCGILIDALRKYRPFTPTFVARAEDQAYIMSVLFEDYDGYLRYLHKDGLIMRHDKEAFAREAIEKAWAGKFAGDLARTLVFSYYARALPWGVERVKEQMDPFTGCFVSRIPITVTYLRLALRSAWLFGQGKGDQAEELLETAAAKLNPILQHIMSSKRPFRGDFEREKAAWDLYYDVIDHVEEGLRRDEPWAQAFCDEVRALVDSTKVA